MNFLIKILISMLFLNMSSYASAKIDDITASQIMDKVEKSLRSKDEVASVNMTITEKNGNELLRSMVIKKKNKGKKQYVLVRLEGPTDVRGVGLLSVIEGINEDQWLYLPSSKKSRRIISSKKKENFMGSEISYEDLSPTTYKHFSNKIVKTSNIKGKDVYIIESESLSRDAAYSKMVTWVTKKDFRLMQAQYFDQKGDKLKVMTFKKYKKFGKNTWRAQNIEVKNYQNGRGTVLALSKLRLNTGLSISNFTKTALEKY